MAPSHEDRLQALRALLEAQGAGHLLRGARLEEGPAPGAPALRVAGAFARDRLDGSFAPLVRAALGPAARVLGDEAPRPRPRADRIRVGKGNEFAVRMVRATVDGGEASVPLLVLYGPPGAGKSLLLRWAEESAKGRAFRVDLDLVKAGRSRHLVPRKRLVLVDGLESLSGRAGAQRTLRILLDGVADRGGRSIVTVRGHPRECSGLEPALKSRLLGGVLVSVEAVPARGGAPPPPSLDSAALLERLKDAAAGAFRVERTLLDLSNKRRGVVEAKRAVIAEAARHGLPRDAIASSLGLKSARTVKEACRWVERKSGRDARFAALVRAVGRVLPRP